MNEDIPVTFAVIDMARRTKLSSVLIDGNNTAAMTEAFRQCNGWRACFPNAGLQIHKIERFKDGWRFVK